MLFQRRSTAEQNWLRILKNFTQGIRSISNLKELLRNFLRTSVEIAEARTGVLLLLDSELKAFVVRESLGGDPLQLQFSTQDSFVHYLGQTATFLMKSQLLSNPRLVDVKESGLCLMTSVNADVIYPLIAEGKFVGILTLGHRKDEQEHSRVQLEFLEVLTALGAVAMDNAILYDSLTKQNLKLAEMAKLKTQFVSTISHELSTPLNGILGMTQVLLDPETGGSLNDDQRRYLEMIASAGEELSLVVHQILELARVQSKQGILEVRKINLLKLVQGLLIDYQPIFLEKGFLLRVELDSASYVYGDEGQIRQVLQSLLENALKFSRSEGSKIIEIYSSRHGDMLQVSVLDSGIGIEESDQNFIFEEFRQVDGSHGRSYGGTGLGLALAKKIIELHGGRIWVESKKGEGAQFYFTLPLKPGLVQVTELDSARH